MSQITVFAAREIITMDPNRPRASHVAVQDGHILAVGGQGLRGSMGRCCL